MKELILYWMFWTDTLLETFWKFSNFKIAEIMGNSRLSKLETVEP